MVTKVYEGKNAWRAVAAWKGGGVDQECVHLHVRKFIHLHILLLLVHTLHILKVRTFRIHRSIHQD